MCVSIGDLENAKKVHVLKNQRQRRRVKGEGKLKAGGRGRKEVDGETVGHVGCVLALAVSTDGTYLVSKHSI